MRLERFALHLFENPNSPSEISISVPEGSKIVDIKAIGDGIYAFYEISELEVPKIQQNFVILKPNQSIPINSKFITIVDVVMDGGEKGQVQVIFPIYSVETPKIIM